MAGHRDMELSEKVRLDFWGICIAVGTEAPGLIHSPRRGNWVKEGAGLSSGPLTNLRSMRNTKRALCCRSQDKSMSEEIGQQLFNAVAHAIWDILSCWHNNIICGLFTKYTWLWESASFLSPLLYLRPVALPSSQNAHLIENQEVIIKDTI